MLLACDTPLLTNMLPPSSIPPKGALEFCATPAYTLHVICGEQMFVTLLCKPDLHFGHGALPYESFVVPLTVLVVGQLSLTLDCHEVLSLLPSTAGPLGPCHTATQAV